MYCYRHSIDIFQKVVTSVKSALSTFYRHSIDIFDVKKSTTILTVISYHIFLKSILHEKGLLCAC